MTTHEDLGRAHVVAGSSDRAFGFVFAAFLGIVATAPLASGEPVRTWALAAGAVFLLAAWARPGLLRPLHAFWLRLGSLLHRVWSPVVLAVLLYLVVTPIGLLMRLGGKDPLRLRREPAADSYWIRRDPPGPPAETMRNQF